VRRRLLLPLVLILLAAVTGLAATLLTDSSPELGLDLQGGVSVVLEPTGEVSGDELDVAVDIIRVRVDALGVAEPDIARQGDTIVVEIPGVENRERVLDLVGQTAELRFRPVLTELPGEGIPPEGEEGEDTTTTTGEGTATTAGESPTTTAPEPDEASEDEATFGSEATGLVEGESAAGRPVRSLQSQQDPTQQPDTTAPADPTQTTQPADPTQTTQPTEPVDPGDLTAPEITPRDEDEADAEVTLPDKDGALLYMLGPALATGRVVESAQAELDQVGSWQIALTMRGGEEGIDLFNEAALRCSPPDPSVCPTGRLSIVLDSVVQSAPTINNPPYPRDAITITGDFSESEAKDLALVLRYGSLPVELERQTVQTVSATLGDDSLRAGVLAGIVGLVLVAVYMTLYYRALGLVVVGGLAVWGTLLYSIISWLGATQGLALTLAGVTGIIVSIGVTVDSYVVYFERLKDEVRSGRTLRTSTERAFRRAFRTILAADVSAFIGAAVLWWLTVGSVRGFAFFLGLSTVLDVTVAWFFTRPVVTYLSRNRVFTEAPFLGVARGLALPAATTSAAGGGGR
jgi:preprotein translocase subunit SecD